MNPKPLVVVLAFLLAACGGKSDSDPGTTSGGSSSGGAASTQGGSQSRGGMTGAGGTSAGGACSAFGDDDGWAISIEIVNRGSQKLHLGQREVNCGLSPLFSVRDANGLTLAPPATCRQPCSSVFKGGAIGCPGICLYPSALTLAPGEIARLRWDGLAQADVAVPQICLSPGVDAAGVCDHLIEIEPGTFTFEARAGTELDCSSVSPDAACSPCKRNDNGNCTTDAALLAGDEVVASTTVKLDPGYGVGEGGGDVPLPVVLVFND